MKKPTKPNKPKKPLPPPEKIPLGKVSTSIDLDHLSLKDFNPIEYFNPIYFWFGEYLPKITIDDWGVNAELEHQPYCDFASIESKLWIESSSLVPNPDYELEFASYERSLSSYPKLLENYKNKLSEYKKKMIEYEAYIESKKSKEEQKMIDELKKKGYKVEK
jgi:hypothetical protein